MKQLYFLLVILAFVINVQGQAIITNPVITGADPHAIFDHGKFYIYPTRGENHPQFFTWELQSNATWKKYGPLLNLDDVAWCKEKKGWAYRAWAPSIIEKDQKYYFYYSVGPQSPEFPSCIGVAIGDSAVGKFKDSGQILLTGGDGFEAIDPMVFCDPKDQKYYLYAGGSAGAKLRIFLLDKSLVRIEKEIPTSTPEKFTEGAFMHFHDGFYHLTYSHGNFMDHTYSVHHATSQTPYGPWQYRGAILESDDQHKGPGHHSIVKNKDGKFLIVFHCYNNMRGDGPYKVSRSIFINELIHGENGEIKKVIITKSIAGSLLRNQ